MQSERDDFLSINIISTLETNIVRITVPYFFTGGQYMNVTVFVDDEVCDEYLGPAKQDVNFACQPAIHGSSITVVRHTPPGRKDKSRLRICEINVKGYPGIYFYYIAINIK